MIENGAYDELVPECASVFFIVFDRDCIRSTFFNRPANDAQMFFIRLFALKKPAISHQNLIPGISGNLLEALVDVNERIVLQIGIGNRQTYVHQIDGTQQG
ncbi:hypothetical protein D3C73_1365040 [compost metagenome]